MTTEKTESKMELTESQQRLIDLWLADELAGEQQQEFDSLMAENADFAEQAQLQRAIVEGLRRTNYRPPQTGWQRRLQQRIGQEAEISQAMQQQLQSMSVPSPGPGFGVRILSSARRELAGKRSARLSGMLYGAVAASLTAAVALASLVGLQSGDSAILDQPTADIAVLQLEAAGAERVQQVQLNIRVAQTTQQAEIWISLPHNVEIDGYPEERELVFYHDLRSGDNHFVLPVLVFPPNNESTYSELVAEVVIDDERYSYPVQVQAIVPKSST